ncbi:MAG: hypothetical protein ACRC62_39995 [Microcoleus sp.]
MSKLSIHLPDDLLNYVNQKAPNPSALIESLLQQWRQQQESIALAEACKLIEELNLGWDEECQTQAIAEENDRHKISS